MKKSCSFCGKIHEKNYICPHRPVKKKRVSEIDRFRWSIEWKNKREEIRKRDLNLCVLCRLGLYTKDGGFSYNSEVDVHHITPLVEDFSQRLENDNLICLCGYHHELAEKGAIPRQKLRESIPPCPLPPPQVGINPPTMPLSE